MRLAILSSFMCSINLYPLFFASVEFLEVVNHGERQGYLCHWIMNGIWVSSFYISSSFVM